MAEYVMTGADPDGGPESGSAPPAYTKSGCPFCAKARSLLERRGASYEEYDLSRNSECYPELQLRLWRSGVDPAPLTVPQIFRGSEYIGGSDRLEAYLRRSGQ